MAAFARSRGARPSLSAGLWDMDLLSIMSQGPPLLPSPHCTGQTQAGLQHSELMSAPSPCPHPMKRGPRRGSEATWTWHVVQAVDVWISGRVEPSACRGGEAGSSRQAGTAPGPHLPSTPPRLTGRLPLHLGLPPLTPAGARLSSASSREAALPSSLPSDLLAHPML